MSFPYTMTETFEDGTSARFAGTGSNGNSKLNVRHYSWLTRNVVPAYPEALPYRGAYALHCNLALGTADAYVQEDTAFDLTASEGLYLRFYFYASGNLTMAASDRFSIFQLQSTGPVSEASIDIRNNSGTIEILASETGAAATVRACPLLLDAWHCLELAVTLDSGGGDGTMNFFVDGYQVGAQVTGLTQAEVIQARLGAMNIDAGTTAGHLLFDQFVVDDTRVYPLRERYPLAMTLTESGHVAVGPGRIGRFSYATAAAADCQIAVFDTDDGNINAAQSMLTSMVLGLSLPASTVGEEQFDRDDGRGYFTRGCYVFMSGTNPRATLWLDQGSGNPVQMREQTFKRAPSSVV